MDAPPLPLCRSRREPRDRRGRRARQSARGVHRGGVGRSLENRGRRRALAPCVRQRARAGDRRACDRAFRAHSALGRHGRDLLHPVDDRTRRWRLSLHRCWAELAAHGARFHGSHRPHRDRSHQSPDRIRVRARPCLRSRATTGRLSYRRRRQDVDAHAVRRPEHRLLGSRDRSQRSQHALCGDVAVRSEDVALAERRAGQRVVGFARRRAHMEAPGRSRASSRQSRDRQGRGGGRAVEPEHGLCAGGRSRSHPLPQ